MRDRPRLLTSLRNVMVPLSVLLLSGCCWPYWPFSGVVYTSGGYDDGSKKIACYWVGTVRTDLAGDGAHSAAANSIVALSGRTFVAGTYSDGSQNHACIWVSKVRTNLSDDGLHSSEASDICLADLVWYVCGSWSDGVKSTACYWKDGERVDLPGSGTLSASASSIQVSEGSVYISGYLTDPATKDNAPCYWKDGERVDLPIPAVGPEGAVATGICVDDGTVYTAGWYLSGVGCYWEGSEYVGDIVDDHSEYYPIYAEGRGASITTWGSALFFGGTADGSIVGHGSAAYWTGTPGHELTVDILKGSGPGSHAGGGPLYVHGGDIYTAGWYQFYDDDPPGPNELYYWFNEAEVRLPYPDQPARPAYISSIFVG